MKTLFITHNNWNTIKQRSHFLSEKMHSKKNRVTVAYKWSPKKFNYSKNNTKLNLIPCIFFPFSLLSIKFIRIIDELIWRFYLASMIKEQKFDNIIITHALFYRYLKNVNNSKIIYDCHDDLELFYKKSKLKELINKENLNLLKNSELNIFSSKNLLKKYGKYGKKSILIRNGHNLKKKLYLRKKKKLVTNLIYFILEQFLVGLILR